MNLDEIKEEIIKKLSLHYDFEVLDSEDMDGDIRELSLDFKSEFDITNIKEYLKFEDINLHIVAYSHILVILVDVIESHVF